MKKINKNDYSVVFDKQESRLLKGVIADAIAYQEYLSELTGIPLEDCIWYNHYVELQKKLEDVTKS